MKKTNAQLTAINLVGITCRTNNDHIFEKNIATNKIAATIQRYFHENLAAKISHRVKPGTTYCVYTDYESDHRGNYTYFIGEAVTAVDELPKDFHKLTIPAQNYVKFTNHAGPMPDVCINMWEKIWAMTPEALGAQRGYLADFEIYDERAYDHQNVVLDIYIGIQNH